MVSWESPEHTRSYACLHRVWQLETYHLANNQSGITKTALVSLENTKLITSSSSFNDKPIRETAAGPLGMELFQKEQDDLLSDLNDIPKKACDRRVRNITIFRKHFRYFSFACAKPCA